MVRVLRTALEEADRSGDNGMARTYLLVDLGAVASRVLGRRGPSSEGAEALAELASEPESDGGGRGQGRSTLSRLFLLGAVVGIGYMLSRRSGSMDEVVDKATERARSVADETAMRSGEIAGRTETATQEAAEKVEEAGEKAAESVEEGGEAAADQIEQAGETVENVEQQAEESAEEMTDTGEGGEETEE
jgi:hypothetical protein